MFYKNGDKNDYYNYRPLTMLNHEFKALSRMILLGISADIDRYLDDTQNGFRTARSTRDNLLTLRWIMNLILTSNQEKLAMFIDYKSAFPSVAHNQILKSLHDANIKQKHINLIKLILKHAKIRYKYNNNWATFNGVYYKDVVNPIFFFSHHHVVKPGKPNQTTMNINAMRIICFVKRIGRKCI